MSIPDNLILHYFELVTDVPDKELEEFKRGLGTESVNPMNLKKRLAREIVTQLYDQKAATEAEKHFVKVFQKGEMPGEIPEFRVSFNELKSRRAGEEFIDISRLLVETGLAESRSEANRLISQGGTVIADKVISSRIAPVDIVQSGTVIKVGKRRFAKVINTDILK